MSNTVAASAMGHVGHSLMSGKPLKKEVLTTGAIAALLLHIAAAAGIYRIATTVPVSSPVPIIVSMITAPTPEPIRPQPQVLPKPIPPKPVAQKPLPQTPKPLLAATEKPVAPAQAAPAPQPQPPATAPTEAPPAPAMVQPRFDAAYLDNPAPPYPPMARRMGETGRVMLHVFVNADGSAGKIELSASSGSTRLDQSALDTVKRWRFVPAKLGTQAVAAWVLVPISFTLGG